MLGFIANVLASVCLTSINGENIVRHFCNAQATFYKVASNYSMIDASNTSKFISTGPLGCVDLCIEHKPCKAFNFKRQGEDGAVCELVQRDRTTHPNGIIPRNGWDYYDTGRFMSQIGQVCRSFKYNPCYPCLCIDSCFSHPGYTCNCTQESPPQPQIYISFEKTAAGYSTKIPYDRGADAQGKAQVLLSNGANIGTSTGRLGSVLRIQGTNAGGIIGSFENHPIKNPLNFEYSISLWLRVVTPQSHSQLVFGCGKMGHYTGTLLKVYNLGEKMVAKVIKFDGVLAIEQRNLGDTLKSWTHVALSIKMTSDAKMELHINGRLMKKVTSFTQTSASYTGHYNLIFGAGTLYSLQNDNWNMQIDDFAIWRDRYLTHGEVIYIMNKGFTESVQ